MSSRSDLAQQNLTRARELRGAGYLEEAVERLLVAGEHAVDEFMASYGVPRPKGNVHQARASVARELFERGVLPQDFQPLLRRLDNDRTGVLRYGNVSRFAPGDQFEEAVSAISALVMSAASPDGYGAGSQATPAQPAAGLPSPLSPQSPTPQGPPPGGSPTSSRLAPFSPPPPPAGAPSVPPPELLVGASQPSGAWLPPEPAGPVPALSSVIHCRSCGRAMPQGVPCVNCVVSTRVDLQALQVPRHPDARIRPPKQKSKTTSVILVVFFGLFGWIYTYQRDAWKFWLNLGLTVVTIGLWSLVAWVWAIIDVAVRPAAWYEAYPNGSTS